MMMEDITITVHSGRVHGARGRFVRRAPLTHVCQVCGVTFPHKAGGTANKACNRTCGFELRRRQQMAERKPRMHDHPPMPKECGVCSTPFISTQSKQVLCSNRCRTEYQQRRKHPERYALTDCSICGLSFMPTYGDWRRVCSDACQVEVRRRARKNARRSRRARMKSVAYERFQDVEIFMRDGYSCGICGKKTDRSKTVPHPKAPTLDHVWPVSKGGGHTRANVQCAHFLCNSLKSDQAGSQLLLIG